MLNLLPYFTIFIAPSDDLFLCTARRFNCLSYNGLHVALTIQEASIILQEVDSEESDGSNNYEDLIFRKQRVLFRFFNRPSSIQMSRQWLENIDFNILISILQFHWKVAAIASQYIKETLSINPVTGEP